MDSSCDTNIYIIIKEMSEKSKVFTREMFEKEQ